MIWNEVPKVGSNPLFPSKSTPYFSMSWSYTGLNIEQAAVTQEAMIYQHFLWRLFFLMQQCTLNYASASFIPVSWISCSTPVGERYLNISLWGLKCLQAFLDNKGKFHHVLSLGKLQMTFYRQEESFKKCEVSLPVSSEALYSDSVNMKFPKAVTDSQWTAPDLQPTPWAVKAPTLLVAPHTSWRKLTFRISAQNILAVVLHASCL